MFSYKQFKNWLSETVATEQNIDRYIYIFTVIIHFSQEVMFTQNYTLNFDRTFDQNRIHCNISDWMSITWIALEPVTFITYILN